MQLSDYIGEATAYDKKEMVEVRKPKSWLKSVSAFANGGGGILIFGVSDNDQQVGLADAKRDAEKISEIIKTKMDPVPVIDLIIHLEQDREFVVLRVFAGTETPYYYTGEGGRTAFVRIGNESVPASAVDLKRLVLRGSSASYDSLTSLFSFDSLAFTKLRSVYRLRTGNVMTDADFASFDLIDNRNMLTNAGVLLADESPLRHSRVFCTRWQGLDKASGIIEALDDKEFSGSLITLLQNSAAFVKNNTKNRWTKTGEGRVEMPDYPELAVQEVLVNALIHRDYLEIGSEVHVDIFDDRLEVYSPGGMVDGSIVQNLDLDHVSSKRRNPVISDVFSRLRLMERRGSGFRKIREAYRRAATYRPSLEPRFCSTSSSFFATLYNLNYNVSPEQSALAAGSGRVDETKVSFWGEKVAFDSEKVAFCRGNRAFGEDRVTWKITANTQNNIRKMFASFGAGQVFGRREVAALLGISSTAAGNLINKLKNAGLIEAIHGHGKGRYKFLGIQ